MPVVNTEYSNTPTIELRVNTVKSPQSTDKFVPLQKVVVYNPLKSDTKEASRQQNLNKNVDVVISQNESLSTTKRSKIKLLGGGVYDGYHTSDMKKHGHGVMKYSDGSVYDGQWEQDEKHGFAIFDYASGDRYTITMITFNIMIMCVKVET